MEKIKNNKKEICIFLAILLFIASQVLPKSVNNLDEMWNFNFARCINMGLIPYKEFNIIQGPLLPAICSIFLKIFGQEMLVTRLLAIILDSTIIFMMYIIMKKIQIKDNINYIILLVSCIIMMPYFTIDYNWATLLLVLVIILIEINSENSWKKNLTLGILAGISITLKQSTGLIIVLATFGVEILKIRKKDEIKQAIKNIGLRLVGVLLVLMIFLIIIIKLNALNEYVDYCILGIKTFSNKISYINGLIKNKKIIIKILSIIPLFIYGILGFNYIKTNNKKMVILLTYSIAQMSVVYPISDESHFVVGIVPTLLSIGYVLDLLAKKIEMPKKVEIFAKTFIFNFIFIFSIIYSIYGLNNFRSQNINTELKGFKYLPMSKESIGEIKKIDSFITSQKQDTYILDATAAIYMIPIDRYNKDYDMFLKGNLGSKGEEGQIDKLKNTKNIRLMIKSEKYIRNWQNPENVRKYIINNMKKIGEIGIFDIYE